MMTDKNREAIEVSIKLEDGYIKLERIFKEFNYFITIERSAFLVSELSDIEKEHWNTQLATLKDYAK